MVFSPIAVNWSHVDLGELIQFESGHLPVPSETGRGSMAGAIAIFGSCAV